jgi:type I restriction enzyme S subunit
LFNFCEPNSIIGTTYKLKEIGEICKNICSGGTPSTSNLDYYNGEINWLRTQEVDYCEIYDTSIKITEKGLIESSTKLIPINCVIVAMYGATAAKVAINEIPLCTNQACCNLEINNEVANYKYVYYYLCDKYEKLKSLGEGSQHNINSMKVKKFQIPIPPLEEQNKIVKILDKFDKLINDMIGEVLPVEIKNRKQQYEYYSNQLLTFKELKNS